MDTSWRRRPHSYATFAPEDVADAERGFPIADLAGTLDHANVVARARHAWTNVGVQPA